MSVITTPTAPRHGRPTPVAIAIAAELLIWAGLITLIVFAVRSCGS
ncbi:hypothetical protein [Caulobacter sp. RHG1]|nr:hypothetical protein [Caulobacter sp. RHG1]NQE62926.1 hypothetical protein [Caulobacter sp. RHG1]